ncbi:MAG: Smr/MutS family protein [Bdellovibrionales bacterium]|nr:Smr/MutS family protein [Bdellovibrionales bacterium]
MSVNIGDHVFVTSLHKTGTVLRVLKNGSVQVRVGTLTITIPQVQLQKIDAPKRPKHKEVPRGAFHHPTPLKSPVSARTLDLHGLTVADAREKILTAIDLSIRDGAEELLVIHGHGTGKLRELTYSEISNLSVVLRVVPDPHNAGMARIVFH